MQQFEQNFSKSFDGPMQIANSCFQWHYPSRGFSHKNFIRLISFDEQIARRIVTTTVDCDMSDGAIESGLYCINQSLLSNASTFYGCDEMCFQSSLFHLKWVFVTMKKTAPHINSREVMLAVKYNHFDQKIPKILYYI